jgi:hypothetical protein
MLIPFEQWPARMGYFLLEPSIETPFAYSTNGREIYGIDMADGAGVPNTDTISVKHIDAHTIQSTSKKGGEVVMTVTSTVSKDGKTWTSTFKGKDAQGRDVNNVVVYDKQ